MTIPAFEWPVSCLSPETIAVFQKTSVRRLKLRNRFLYYHQETVDFFNQHIPRNCRVLWIGLDAAFHSQGLHCKELQTLELDPTRTLDPDFPPSHAKRAFDEVLADGPWDYILLPHTLQFLDDIQGFLEKIHAGATEQTRVIIVHYNFLWAPVIKLTQILGLKSPMPALNWLNFGDIDNFLFLTDFQTITQGYRCLIPIGIPFFARWLNRYWASIPFWHWACQKTYVIARPFPPLKLGTSPTVSIVIPARNEAGNIAPLLDRLPVLGRSCEVIFVEGHSTDATWDSILRESQVHSRRHLFRIQALQQSGNGKADAVRLGFSKATGDLLMILDADMTVQPEDLTHFFDAWVRGKAEFLNGSRLVYQMENEAMQVLNLFFNKLFALLISWLIGQRIKDSLCGTKALHRREYLRIRDQFAQLSKLDPFGDFELLLGASKLSLKISDVVVRYKRRTYGQTNILRFRHGWELLRLCWKCWPEVK